MQLKRLTGLEKSKIEDELKSLHELIANIEELLKDVLNFKSYKKELYF